MSDSPATPEALRALFHVPIGYFDSAFTSLVPRPVVEAVTEALNDRWNAPYERLEAARARIAACLGALPEEVELTTGTTGGLARVARGLALGKGDRVVTTVADHRSIRGIWGPAEVIYAGVDADGCVIWEEVEAALPGARVLALALASNVTGEIAPVARLAGLAREAGAWVVVDAAQGAAHLPLAPRSLGADFLAFSGHKVWGPAGIGVLWRHEAARAALSAEPPGGMPAYEGTIGLACALELLAGSCSRAMIAHREALVRRLDSGMRALPGVRVLGPREGARRLPIFSMVGPTWHPPEMARRLQERGFRLRSGAHHCEPLHQALGLEASLRASVHAYTSEAEVEVLLEALQSLFGD